MKPLTTTESADALQQGALTRARRVAQSARDEKGKTGLQERAERGAEMFEKLLVRQMFTAMRKTLPESSPLRNGSGPGGHLYMQFVDDAISEHLGSAGIGLRRTLVRSLGGDPDLVHKSGAPRSEFPADARTLARGQMAGSAPGDTIEAAAPGPALPGATGLLQKSATQLLSDGGHQRFSKQGRVSAQDLASPIATENTDGIATFNASAADGYQGHSKCNLFALEAARRAGYAVPVVARSQGWGFPSSDRVAHDAADGKLKGDWAQVATGTPASQLDAEITAGRGAFLLVGSAPGERHGHMAVVERIRSVDYGPNGEVRRVVFDGYEARDKGAMRLEQRTWNLQGNRGGRGARNGFSGIELLRLRRPESAGENEVPLSGRAPSSRNSNFVSSDAVGRPMTDLEEEP